MDNIEQMNEKVKRRSEAHFLEEKQGRQKTFPAVNLAKAVRPVLE